MKKFSLVALFALAVFGVAFAATTGTVGLQGSVADQFSLTLPGNFTGVMDDGVGALNNWGIGDVKVISNFKNWTITVASANAGYLVHSVDGNEKVAYTFSLGSLVSAQGLAIEWTSAAQARTEKCGNTYALGVSFTAGATSFWQAGTYNDTLTITIAKP